jgi:FkbM family methyltransferase
MRIALAKLGNVLYDHCPRAYQPLYAVYKAVADRAERRLLRSVLRPGMTAVDVGANIGVYSAFLADLVKPNGRVYAFEPEPRNFGFLEERASRSPCIVPVRAAVGEHSGMLKLYLSDDLNVDHHTYYAGEGRRSTEVQVIRLDEFVTTGTRIDFIKLDIQGYELQALKGALRVLTENYDVKLLLEYWPYGLRRAGTEPIELLRFLEMLGFTLSMTNGVGSEPLLKMSDDINEYANIFATRQ